MAYVVFSPCTYTKDLSCVKVCPVNCFYDAGSMLVIHPEECIDCSLCVAECPVNAISALNEVPEEEKAYIDLNKVFFTGATPEELERLFAEAAKPLAGVDDAAKKAKIAQFLATKPNFAQKKSREEMDKVQRVP